MPTRPKRQLIEESIKDSLNGSSSNPSLASTVPMAATPSLATTPSKAVRRSARIQDSPSISYREGLRSSSVARDSPVRQLGRNISSTVPGRIFGLDVSDKSSALDKVNDSDQEDQEDDVVSMVIPAPIESWLKSQLLPKLSSPQGKGVVASFILLFLLVLVQWLAGLGVSGIVGIVTGPFSGLRTVFMSLPDFLMVTSFRRAEMNEAEMLNRIIGSARLKELIVKLSQDHSRECSRSMEANFINQFDTLRKEVEVSKNLYLETQSRQLAIREKEIIGERSVEEKDRNTEFMSKDREKLAFLELEVDRLRLTLMNFSNQFKEIEDLSYMKSELVDVQSKINLIQNFTEKVSALEVKLNSSVEGISNLDQFNDESFVTLEVEIRKIKDDITRIGKSYDEKAMIDKVVSELELKNMRLGVQSEHEFNEFDELKQMIVGLDGRVNSTEIIIESQIPNLVESRISVHNKEMFVVIDELQSNMSNVHSSLSRSKQQLSSMLQLELSNFSADQTGLVDWFSLALGASVLSTPNTSTYPFPSEELKIFGFSIWKVYSSPNQILQPVSKPGQCWAFVGQKGSAVIQLAKKVKMASFAIEHIRPSPDLSSAPQNVEVFDHVLGKSLLNATYSISDTSSSLQIYSMTNGVLPVVSKLRLEIHSNWGHPDYTCIYRVRIHGDSQKSLIPQSNMLTLDSDF